MRRSEGIRILEAWGLSGWSGCRLVHVQFRVQGFMRGQIRRVLLLMESGGSFFIVGWVIVSESQRGCFESLLALGTIPYDSTDSFLDPDPMILDRDRRSGLVDTRMVLIVYILSNVVLLLGIGYYFLTLQHQPLRFPIVATDKLVMRRCTPKTTLFSPIGSPWVFGMLEVISDLLETILSSRIITFKVEVPPIDDCVDKLPRVG